MKSPSFRQVWRWFTLLTSLFVLVSILQPENSLAAPKQIVFRGGQLHLLPFYAPKTKICVGQKEKFAVLVTNDHYANLPGATVHALDKVIITGADGYARWTLVADKVGQTTLNIYATKDGYFQSESFKTTIDIIQCNWNLRMDYGEEYMDPNTWVFQGSVEVEDTPFTVNDDGSLSLLNGQSSIQGKYHGSLFDLVRPVSCTPDPPLDGPYPIQFSGNYVQGFLNITLSAESVELPSTVTIECTVSDPDYAVAPWTFPTGQILNLINQTDLTQILCPGDGCVRRFKLNRVQLWLFQTANYASGVLVIEREMP